MLPEELSNNLCSLKEGVIRLTATVMMQFDKQGDLIASDIFRSFIKSRKRLTYGEAKKILDNKLKSPHGKAIKLMSELCLLLKKKRYERGSIDFALPELIILIDEKGYPTGVKIEEYDITHQLVEEFMLKANEIVATHFSTKNLPSMFRIHESPAEENLEDFYALARTLGFSLPNKPSAQDIQNLFTKAKETPFAPQLSVAFIRSMKLAIYSHENVGHYGLALENYCHFTSPIRRYSDLIIHRLLFDEKVPTNLEQISKECSEKERLSFKAEKSVITLKKLRLLKKYQDEDPKRIYSGAITKVKPFGFFFEVAPLQIEGFIHVSDLKHDYFEYNSKKQILCGQRTNRIITAGDPVDLFLDDIDLIQMEAKWALIQKKKKKS